MLTWPPAKSLALNLGKCMAGNFGKCIDGNLKIISWSWENILLRMCGSELLQQNTIQFLCLNNYETNSSNHVDNVWRYPTGDVNRFVSAHSTKISQPHPALISSLLLKATHPSIATLSSSSMNVVHSFTHGYFTCNRIFCHLNPCHLSQRCLHHSTPYMTLRHRSISCHRSLRHLCSSSLLLLLLV